MQWNENYSVGVVGHGFVGQALARLFGNAVIFDPAQGLTDRSSINACRVGVYRRFQIPS